MAIADYSDLEKEISNSQEPKTLPRGSEVKFRIISVRSGISDKNGARWFQPVFDVPDDPMVSEFNDFIWDLADGSKLDEKQRVRNMTRFKNFAECIGLDYSKPFSWEDDLISLTGWAILGVRKSDEYGDQNNISKYIVRR